MDELFAIDAKARAEKMDIAQRHLMRQEKAPALLEELHKQILGAQAKVLPKSIAGKAAKYTLTLWKQLTLLLEYPVLELSNNLAENSMRPVAMGVHCAPPSEVLVNVRFLSGLPRQTRQD
jgi:hypothetical protein